MKTLAYTPSQVKHAFAVYEAFRLYNRVVNYQRSDKAHLLNPRLSSLRFHLYCRYLRRKTAFDRSIAVDAWIQGLKDALNADYKKAITPSILVV